MARHATNGSAGRGDEALDGPPIVTHRQEATPMHLTLKVWRQRSPDDKGGFVTYEHPNVSEHMSFLEMLDVLNDELTLKGDEPIAFSYDCREGICGSCGMVIDGVAHGPDRGTAVCQLHMRRFKDGDTLTIEPWRAAAMPVRKDLIVDRSALDRINQAAGYISVSTGSAPEANGLPIPKEDVDLAMDAAQCIQCGACVAACPNASAMLFLAAKVSHLGLLPQGQPERHDRVLKMVDAHDQEGFGGCTNVGACTEVCPKEISQDFISRLNRDLVRAKLKARTA